MPPKEVATVILPEEEEQSEVKAVSTEMVGHRSEVRYTFGHVVVPPVLVLYVPAVFRQV